MLTPPGREGPPLSSEILGKVIRSHWYTCVNEFNIIKIKKYSAKMALLGKGRVNKYLFIIKEIMKIFPLNLGAVLLYRVPITGASGAFH